MSRTALAAIALLALAGPAEAQKLRLLPPEEV
jgi:hypothetical protein